MSAGRDMKDVIQQNNIEHPHTKCAAGPVCPEDSGLQSACRVLAAQYRVVMDNIEGALRGGNPKYLHDIRVAIRRFRAGLRMYREVLRDRTSAQEVDSRLKAISSQLGPIRDAQVWMEFLTSDRLRQAAEGHPSWQPFIERQEARNRDALQALRSLLEGSDFRTACGMMARLIQTEIPARLDADESSGRQIAASRVQHMFKRIREMGMPEHDNDAQALHTLRKKVRRTRYYAEFSGPMLGRAVVKLAHRLKQVTSTLGDVHDMDVHIEQQRRESEKGLEGLIPVLEQVRGEALADFKKAWTAITDPAFIKQVERSLKKYT